MSRYMEPSLHNAQFTNCGTNWKDATDEKLINKRENYVDKVLAGMQAALDAMAVRGEVNLGDKTTLDTMDSLVKALDGVHPR